MRQIKRCLMLYLFCVAAASADERVKLVLLTWEDYLSPKVVEEFEQRYQVDLIETYFESDHDRTRLLEETGAEGVDLILVAGSDIRLYAQNGWLSPLQEELIPTLEMVDPDWRNAFSGSARYGLPYLWGTTGIAYRSDLIKQPISRWMDLFNPDAALHGKIQMTDDSSELVQVALKALGYSLNSDDPVELDKAKQLLMQQRPHVFRYQYGAVIEDSPLLTGDVLAAFCYNGDALMLQEYHSAIRYVVPEEGTNLWGDYIAVSARSDHPDLAHFFLNFINQPRQAARNAQYLYSATPNIEAQKQLPKSMRSDPLIYPEVDVLGRSEFSRMINYEMLRQRHQIGTQLMGPPD